MKTILLIDDNEEILENLAEYLEIEGYKVHIACNGKTGIMFAQEFIPDLVICDVLMPEMNGHEVLQHLSQNHQTSTIPIIFSTSLSEKNEIAQAYHEGAHDYIIKPFEMKELLHKIETCIHTNVEK